MSAVPQPVETPEQAARRLAAGAIRGGFRPTALHVYRNADGTPAYWRIRCKHPHTGDKWIRPFHWDAGEYIIGEPPAPDTGKLLYRLPELLDDPGSIVWVVEGEGCADALADAGKVATTTGSASSADAADWTPLRGRSVVVWPDNNGPGADYAEKVTAHLRALGCSLRRVDLVPLNLPEGGDVVDWLAVHSADDLDGLTMAPAVTASLPPKPGDGSPRVLLVRGDTVTPEAVDWLWDGWLAAGKLHLIGGQPGTGKTTIAMTLAATVSVGGRWPDGTCAQGGSVAIWSGEDDPADTIVPRLLVAGADMGRVHLIDGVQEQGIRYPFDPARDTDVLASALANVPDLRLLVIDPIVSAVSGDSHKNAEVRRGLQPLVDLAHANRCALVGITHFTKGTAGRDPLERFTGSLAFGALARLALATTKQDADGDIPARRLLLRAKSNIGPDGGGFVYDLRQDPLPGNAAISASSVLWGEIVEGSARDLLAEVEQRGDDERIEQRDAADWLRDVLEPGPMSVKNVKRQADDSGFAWRTVQRAMRRAGVESRRDGFGQGATWRLASRHKNGTVAPFAPDNLRGATGATGDSGCANGGVEGGEMMES